MASAGFLCLVAALAISVGLVGAVTQAVCGAITFASTKESFEQNR